MGDAAVAAGNALGYVNAGTVEFIVEPDADKSGGDFYFMEINTRLQVEHPVTEMVLHLDLVELQLRVAAGEALPGSLIRNKSLPADGHALELRLYAEDPQQGFLPGSGKLQRLRLPLPSAHVRVDAGVVEGDTVTIFYDPMIAKLIAWDRTRAEALQRMREALAQSDIVGPKSNIDFLERLVRHPAIVEGRIDTGYLDRHLDEFLADGDAGDPVTVFAAATAWLLYEEAAARRAAAASGDPHSPWARSDGWRLGHPGKRIVVLNHASVAVRGAAGNYTLASGDATCAVADARLDGSTLSGRYDGTARSFRVDLDADRIVVHDGIHRRVFEHTPPFAFEASESAGADSLRAPMPGRIVVVKADAGEHVQAGQEIMVIEAMKMELSLKAPQDATIVSLHASAGEFVEADTVLVRFGEAK